MSLATSNPSAETGGNLDKIAFLQASSAEQLFLIYQEMQKLNNNVLVLFSGNGKGDLK